MVITRNASKQEEALGQEAAMTVKKLDAIIAVGLMSWLNSR